MTVIEKARALRAYIEQAALSLTDVDALKAIELFPTWKSGIVYAVNDRLRYNNVLYKVLQAHTSQADWTPPSAVSLFAKVLIPDTTTIPAWEQPSSTNPYMMGDKVTYSGKIWQSNVDNNVWAPGVYGWIEVTA